MGVILLTQFAYREIISGKRLIIYQSGRPDLSGIVLIAKIAASFQKPGTEDIGQVIILRKISFPA